MMTLRLMWQLVRWPGVFVLLSVSAILFVLSNSGGPSLSDTIMILACAAALMCGRIMQIAGMRTLRMLPDGHRMLVRALAMLTLLLALLVGGFAAHAGVRHFTAEPLGNIALAFVAFSTLSFLMFARELRGRFKTYAELGILAAGVLVLAGINALPAAWSWFAAAAFALLWLIALATRGVPRLAPANAAGREIPGFAWLARLQTSALLARTPAATILNSDRGPFARLTDAVAVTIVWALVIYFIARHQRPVDSYVDAMTLLASAAAVLILVQSWVTPARARLLWLLSGASRTGIFRLAERTLIVNLIVLGIIAWLAASGLAWLHGIPVGAGEALLRLAGSLAGGLAPIYFGLLLPTLTRAWQRIPVATLAAVTVALGPAIWIRIVIGDAVDGAEFTHLTLALGLVVTCLLLRAIAIQRWRSIDWITTRTESRIAM